MNEDLREKAEAQEKVNQLQVNRRFQGFISGFSEDVQTLVVLSRSEKVA